MNTAVKGKLGLAIVRSERDQAFKVLRGLRLLGLIPEGRISRHVNCLVALESEGDIEDAEMEARAWLRQMSREAPR